MNLIERIVDQVGADPARTAICEPGGRQIDFGGLRRRTLAIARYLAARGIRPGDRVALQMPPGVDLTATILAVLWVGGVGVLCDPGLGRAVYLSRVRLARPSWLIVSPAVVGVNAVPGLAQWLSRREVDVPPLLSEKEGVRRIALSRRQIDRLVARSVEDPGARPVPREDDSDAILTFTGGTTSAPKGVRHTHGSLEYFISSITSVLEPMLGHRILVDTQAQIFYTLKLGRTAYLSRGRRQKRAEHTFDLIRSGVVDAYLGAPYVWMEMLARAGSPRSPLPEVFKTVLLVSAPVTRDLLRTIREWLHPDARIMTLYGMTEAGGVCVAPAGEKLEYALEGDYVGGPLEGVEVAIVDPHPVTGVGEVEVRSPALFAGYLDQPPRNPSESLKTGDLGHWAELEGKQRLVLMGRMKDMIIRRGVNLYPGTLEPTITALCDARGPFLRECALIGAWNRESQDEEVILCVRPAEGRRSLDMEMLRRRVASVVGPDGAPDHILVVDSMPVTGRLNKLDRNALRAEARARFGLGPLPGERGGAEDAKRVEPVPDASAGAAGSDAAGLVGSAAAGAAGSDAAGLVGSAAAGLVQETPCRPAESGGSVPVSRPSSPWDWLPGLRIPFDFRTFLEKHRVLLRHESPLRVGSQLVARLGLHLLSQTGWALDELVARKWRNAKVCKPIFILGHQRSGTTLLHRLLASDRTHGRAMSLLDMLFPAVSFHRMLGWISALDARLGGHGRAAVDRLEAHIFRGLDPIHRIRLGEVEEDEFVLWAIYGSAACANDAPGIVEEGALETLRHFEQWPLERQVRVMGYYRACLMKKLYRVPGPDASEPVWVVAKNPAFTQKIDVLRRVFPDARFVYLIRNPLEAIPSRLNLIRAVWRGRSRDFREMTQRQADVILADSVRTYLSAERDLARLPEELVLTVRYEELVRSPRAVVDEVYRHFHLCGPGPSPEVVSRITGGRTLDAGRQGRAEGGQRSLLEGVGIGESRIREKLEPVFARYRFGLTGRE